MSPLELATWFDKTAGSPIINMPTKYHALIAAALRLAEADSAIIDATHGTMEQIEAIDVARAAYRAARG